MNLTKLKRALEKNPHTFDLLDNTLYDLCETHPSHTDPQAVHAKTWLIARTFTTGIERQIKTDGSMGGALAVLAKEMLKHGKDLDRLFAELRSISEPLTAAKAEKIVRIHGHFLQLIRNAIRWGRSPRSFVSKYIHFHCRQVPIFDSVSAKKLHGMVPWRNATKFSEPRGADLHYAWYVMQFLTLYNEAQKQGVKATVRQLDGFLIAAE